MGMRIGNHPAKSEVRTTDSRLGAPLFKGVWSAHVRAKQGQPFRHLHETRFGPLNSKMDSQSMANPRVGRPSLGPALEVVIEVPRGSFVKRGSSGSVDFISPLPCPFNYGAVPTLLGLEGDLLDAVVLGKRIAYGTGLRVIAYGAVTF